MSPEQKKLNELFSEALAKASPEEREHYLASACGQDSDLRRQVDSLLFAHGEVGDFLKHTTIASNGQPIGEGPGSVIGRYKLLQQIGEGGFGVVFMAEQQEPVRRMVALKIIKVGMDTREMLARFEAGRQALALMDHPNIARVLDGGATDSGRPFFVMELIKGIPITEFCVQHNLSIEARLQLFMKVCAGVQHAHQKGVIHRDIKPSNVLVTLHDGEPVPKVIDFGIAKALGQKLTERTLFTRFEQLIGTPAYMSPEQAEWSGLDIDTRSDLYSLGVLLYEMLTGTTPLEKETLARAALDEMRRMIRETDPPKPSTRLTALAAANSASQITRSAFRQVHGDLDWIVMKCLEKDRARRYETVNGLARDIERHLGGEPVVACPPSKTYLTGKFLRKHRVGVAAVAGVALALVAGLVLALLGFTQAQRERQRAQNEAAIAKAVSSFLTDDLLGQANPEHNPNRDLKLREVLDRAAQKINGRFTNQPLVEASIRYTLGHTYLWLSELDAAEPHILRAIEIRTQRLGPDHRDTLEARQELGILYDHRGMVAEAEFEFLQLADDYRRTLGPEHADTLDVVWNLGAFYMQLGRTDQGEDILRDVLERQRRVRGAENRATLRTMCSLAKVYGASGQYSEAARLNQEAFGILHRVQGPEDWVTVEAMKSLACDYFTLGDYAQAADLFRECREIQRRLYGPDHKETLDTTFGLAAAYGCMGSWAPCVEFCRELTQATNHLQECSMGMGGAAIALLAGDTNAYREFVARGVAQLGNTTNANWARSVAGVCLLVPDALPDLAPVFRMADLAPQASARYLHWSKITKGKSEYRRGDFFEALKWFDGWRGFPIEAWASQAGYFCAMIHYRQGDKAAAQADMKESAERLDSFLLSGGMGRYWSAGCEAVVVRAEAERLILGREVSPRFDAAWLESARKQWEPVRRHLTHAERLACQRKWSEACADYLAATRQPVFDWNSVSRELAQRMAITFLLAGDRQNFEQLCREWFTRLEKNPEPGDACFAVRTCLAGEPNVTTYVGQLALKWSGKMESSDPESLSWVQAMIAYRSGQYEDAIKHAKAAETSMRLGMRSAARILHAMALAKSGQSSEGKQELAQAVAQLGRHLTNMTGDVWWDLGLCQLALDEAHQLFAASPAK